MLKDLIKLANVLDVKGLYKEADALDKIAMSLGRENEWDFDFSEEKRDESIKGLVGTLIDQGRGLNLKEDLAELEGHSLRLLRELRGKEDKELDDRFKEAFSSYVEALGDKFNRESDRSDPRELTEKLTEEFKRYLEQFIFGEDPSYDPPTGIDNL